MVNTDIPPKVAEPKAFLYLKGVKLDNAKWFRKEAARLRYDLNEFFDMIIEARAKNGSGNSKAASKRKAKPARKNKPRSR